MCRHHNNKARSQRTTPETENAGQNTPSPIALEPNAFARNNSIASQVSESICPIRIAPPNKPGKPIHKCGKCNRQFQYEYGLKRHMRSDHLHKNTVMESGFVFGDFGKVKKPDINPRKIKGEIEEVIVDKETLKLVSMNVFSLVPPEKKLFVKNGILDSGADIIAISETKFSPHTNEFKVPGYYQAATITRKAGAGGLLIMAKNTIRLHSIVVKNVDKESIFKPLNSNSTSTSLLQCIEAQRSPRELMKRNTINA